MSIELSLSAKCGLTGMVALGGAGALAAPPSTPAPGVSDSWDEDLLVGAAAVAAVVMEANLEVKLL